MPENGITIRVLSQFGPDQKSVPQILNIINPAKIPCIDMPFCDDSIKRKIAEGGILVVENGGEQNKTVIGAILTHWIQKNKSGEFSVAFDKAVRNNRDMVARTIDSFKNCAFNEMRLSLVTIIVSSGDSLPEILLEKNFINGLDLTCHNYFSISNNGSKLTNLTENGHSAETPESDGAEIKNLRLALEKSNEVCRMAYTKIEELKKALKEAQENELTTGEEPSSQVAELKKQLEEAQEKHKQAQKKFNEWRDSKNQELKETQKTIADRDTTIKRLDGEIIELSKLLGEKTLEKNPAKEKRPLADVKLVPRDLQILQIIIESGQSGIFQQEIIKKTGSNQSDISRAVRIFADKKLVENQKVGTRSKAIAQMDQIRLQFPDMIKPMKQSEPEKPEEKTAKPVIVQEPPQLPETKTELETHETPQTAEVEPEPDKKPEPVLIPLSDSSADPELELLDSLPDNRIQQTKDYLNDCLEKGEEISLFVICSKAGVKKDQSELFVSALVKSMNKMTDDPNNRMKAVKFSINEDDFAKSTIELLSETELLNELEKNKPAETKPEKSEEKIVTLDELKKDLQDKKNGNENADNTAKITDRPKRTLAQLLNTSGICDVQRKMLTELGNAGGSLTKKELKQKTGIPDFTFKSYLEFMMEHKVIKIEGEKIFLNL